MMSKHTPGPWSYSIDRNYVRIYLHGLGRIDEIHGGDSLRGYCGEANARLIAAAPDMLDMLKKCLDALEYVGPWETPVGLIERVQVLIDKAEGIDATTE